MELSLAILYLIYRKGEAQHDCYKFKRGQILCTFLSAGALWTLEGPNTYISTTIAYLKGYL